MFGVLDYDAFLVSLWVQPNDAGTSLPEQVNAIAARLTDETEFRKKVLGLGYRDEHARLYETKLELMEEPAAFPMDAIPRIDEVPDGVTNVHWDIDLGGKTDDDEVELGLLLGRISGSEG